VISVGGLVAITCEVAIGIFPISYRLGEIGSQIVCERSGNLFLTTSLFSFLDKVTKRLMNSSINLE
jgi:hypothetical protein